jgi:hypothetical protein
MPLDQLILTLSHGQRATQALFELLGLAGHEEEDAGEAREFAVEELSYSLYTGTLINFKANSRQGLFIEPRTLRRREKDRWPKARSTS